MEESTARPRDEATILGLQSKAWMQDRRDEPLHKLTADWLTIPTVTAAFKGLVKRLSLPHNGNARDRTEIIKGSTQRQSLRGDEDAEVIWTFLF